MSSPGPVTTKNWGDPPHNRWAFQHVQELFPTCRLARDPSATFVLPTKPQDILPLSFEAADDASTSIGEFLAVACCDAFLVVHTGRLIAEHYFNEMTVNSHHLLNSVTKSFVGMLAGIAVDRDQLEPSSLITRYLPELDNAAWQGTTIRHLLDMTASAQYADAKGDSTSKECFARGVYGDDSPGWHYRNQVWVTGSDPAVMLAIGIHGQYVYMDKGRDLVIVMLSSQPQPFDEALDLRTIAAMNAIGSRLETTSSR